ncbi:helix-turn-helix domain-containing protein [Aphanothece microscopica]|uniref:helix-turn-helix domain-containing protein n=1 Tax=Aphanothece microscopica TaxID=1049561 RepID=UPI003984FCD1
MKMDSSPIREATLPTHTVDTFRLPGDRSREIREYIVDGTFRLEDPPSGGSSHKVRTQVWFLEDLLVASSVAEKSGLYRPRELIERNPTSVVKIRMYRSGRSLLVDGDHQQVIGTDAIHFIDHDRPLRQISTDHDQMTLAVPYSAIGYDPSRHPTCVSFALNTAQGRLLQAGLESVFDEIGALSPSQAPALAKAISGLLRGVLQGCTDSIEDENIQQARIFALKRIIDQNLGDPDLGIGTLQKDFGASRATIYRDFAEDGGLQHYIHMRRLQRAFLLLSEAPKGRGAVQDVATRCGFLSLPHFSRSFRARFGVAPSDAIGRWRQIIEARRDEGHARSGDPAVLPELQAIRWSYDRFK